MLIPVGGLSRAVIKVHAIMHQASRERNAEGSIVATLDDYDVVRELAADRFAEGIGVLTGNILRRRTIQTGQLKRARSN